jgi:hypothetical protein
MPLERYRQLGLFAPSGPIEMTATDRAKIVTLLISLLTEVLSGSAATSIAITQANREAGHDEDHA